MLDVLKKYRRITIEYPAANSCSLDWSPKYDAIRKVITRRQDFVLHCLQFWRTKGQIKYLFEV